MIRRVDWRQWDAFIRDVTDAIEQLNPASTVWYRGVREDNHKCIPSLLRYRNGIEKERSLFERFEQVSRGVNGSLVPRSDWETLYEMQHYGVPTRLLDWTETLGVAVFFACLGADDKDGYVYVLDPHSLNSKQGKADLIGHWDQETFKYRAVFWESKPFRPSTPLAVNPEHSNARLSAQRGRFTIHGMDGRPLEDSVPDCVIRVRLPREAKAAARENLSIFGIDEFDIFPDLAGASMFLSRIVGLEL